MYLAHLALPFCTCDFSQFLPTWVFFFMKDKEVDPNQFFFLGFIYLRN